MVLTCPLHKVRLEQLLGSEFLCPRGHVCASLDMKEVLNEVVRIVNAPAGRGAYAGSYDWYPDQHRSLEKDGV